MTSNALNVNIHVDHPLKQFHSLYVV